MKTRDEGFESFVGWRRGGVEDCVDDEVGGVGLSEEEGRGRGREEENVRLGVGISGYRRRD